MMNPIVDILATVKPTDTQSPGANPTSGDPASTGIFAQAIAEAIGSISAQAAVPNGIATMFVDPNAAPDNGGVKLSEQMLKGIAIQSEAPATADSMTGEAAGTPAVASNLVLALAGAELIPTSPNSSAASLDLQKPVSAALNFARTEGTLLSLPTTAGPTIDDAILQNAIESALTTDLNNTQKSVTIQAQVEISDNAATALVSDQGLSSEDKSAANLASVFPRSPKPHSSASLKAQLRREFPAVRLESASGKLNMQVKLSDNQLVATVPQSEAAVVETAAKAVDLPIVTTNQMARTVSEVTEKKSAQKSIREGAVATKSKPTTLTEPRIDDSRELRQQSAGSIRKPVLQALKSQGFDIEKIMSRTNDNNSAILAGVSEKSAGALAVEKPEIKLVDRSADLNGIERFKLDIKRGHIEALLKKGEIKLQLHPDHLGSLKIKLLTTPTETTARLETSSEDARRAVEASLPALRESFERAGLKLNSVEVVVGNDSDSRRQQAFQQEANARNASNKRQALRSVETLPLISELENTTLAAYGGALNLVA